MRLFITQTGGCKTERKQYKEKRLLFMVLSKDDFISLIFVCVKQNAEYNSYEPNFSNWMTAQIKSVRVKHRTSSVGLNNKEIIVHSSRVCWFI